MPDLSTTPRTALRRHRERGRSDRDELYAILDEGLICHLGVMTDGGPRVLPTGYGRIGDTLYLHGSSANATFMAGRGQQVCVTVTHLDGIVYARSVFNHSMNYRSAMIFGVARPVTDPSEVTAALRAITEHLAPGQWSYVRQPTRKELAATSVLALPLAEASVKVRSGGPKDEPEDHAADVWAGVVPVTTQFGEPEPDTTLRQGLQAPGHVRQRALCKTGCECRPSGPARAARERHPGPARRARAFRARASGRCARYGGNRSGYLDDASIKASTVQVVRSATSTGSCVTRTLHKTQRAG